MTFTTATLIVEEDILQTLSSSKGFLIGYSIDAIPEMYFKSHHDCIRHIINMDKDERKAIHDSEPIIFKHKIASKDSTLADDYSAIRGEIIESDEFLQFDGHSRQWK